MTPGRLTMRLVLATAVGGCAHTHTVGDDKPAAAEQGGPHQGSPPYDANASAAHRPARVAPGPQSEGGPMKSESGVPLPTSPGGLLKPGAAKQIQSKLAATGALSPDQMTGELDGPTRAALARFQAKNDLPATGDPDDSTIRKLGLDAKEIFVSGQ
jgi:hypothetical protein